MELGFVNDYRNLRLRNYEWFARWAQRHENLVHLGAAFLVAIVTAALAQVWILTPLTPVPYTGQVLGVALMGGLLGRKWGTISAAIYVGLGVIGLPVFAGQVGAVGSTGWDRGWVAVTGLTGGYLLGFILQAFLVGWVRDSRGEGTNRRLVGLSAATGLAVTAFLLLDAYALSEAASTAYYTNGTQAWFLGVLVGGEIAVIAAVAWLAFTSKARRERLELFMGNILGLAILYAMGAAVFTLVYVADGGSLDAMTALRLTVLPFIPADLIKILIAIGLLTLLRPTRAELAPRPTPEASATNV